jgi:hypothetical protein
MTWVLLVLWLVTLTALLRVAPATWIVRESGSLRRRWDMRSLNREAIEDANTDRLIRESDHQLAPNEKHKHVNCYICGPGPLLKGTVPSKYQHPFFKDERIALSDGYGQSWWSNELRSSLAEYADVVSSTVIKEGHVTGLHSIMLDFDFPVTVVESTTTGHHHLYIDHLVTWHQYRALLAAMRNCGLIEEGFYSSSVARRATHLRPPWVEKVKHKPAAKVESKAKRMLRKRSK